MNREKVVSYRMKEDEYSALSKLAKNKQIGTSTLAGQITKKYIEIFSKCEKRGDLLIQKPQLKLYFDYIPEEKIPEVREKELTLRTSCMKTFVPSMIFEEMCGAFEGWFDFSDIPLHRFDKQNSVKFVINHNLGKNWSSIVGWVYPRIFQSIGCKILFENIQDDMFEFEISHPELNVENTSK